MWIILIILFLLLLILIPLLWILLARIVIRIDSRRSLYYVEMKWLFRLQLAPENDRVLIRVKVPFWSYSFDPVEEILKPKEDGEEEPKQPEKDQKKKKAGWFRIKKGYGDIVLLVFRLLRSIIHSFRVKRFTVYLDTGDYPLNAQLIPVFAWINRRTAMRYYVNFNDRNSVEILIKNRLIRIIIPVLKTVIKLYT